MAELETNVVVLRRVDYGEADLILTLFGHDVGKISALARAARKSRRRFGGALLSFTVSLAQLRRRPKADLWTLTSAIPVESFPDLGYDVAALAHASYGTELCRELVATEVPEPDIFDLLVELFRCVSKKGPVPTVLRGFELSLLRAIGLEPRLDSCGSCGTKEPAHLERGAVYDPNQGGLVCVRCSSSARGLGVRPLSPDVCELLSACGRARSLLQCAEVRADAGVSAAARDLMLEIVQGHVGAPLKSLEFVAKLGGPRG